MPELLTRLRCTCTERSFTIIATPHRKINFKPTLPQSSLRPKKAYLHATGHLLAGCCSGGKEDVAAVALLFHAFDCLEGGQNFPNPTAKQQSRVFRRINKNILDSTTMLSRRLWRYSFREVPASSVHSSRVLLDTKGQQLSPHLQAIRSSGGSRNIIQMAHKIALRTSNTSIHHTRLERFSAAIRFIEATIACPIIDNCETSSWLGGLRVPVLPCRCLHAVPFFFLYQHACFYLQWKVTHLHVLNQQLARTKGHLRALMCWWLCV